MRDRNSISVKIRGKEFRIRSDEDPEALREIVAAERPERD